MRCEGEISDETWKKGREPIEKKGIETGVNRLFVRQMIKQITKYIKVNIASVLFVLIYVGSMVANGKLVVEHNWNRNMRFQSHSHPFCVLVQDT